MELLTTLFGGESFIETESTNVVEASVEQTKETIEMLVESQSQSSRTTESIGIKSQVLSGHTENYPASVMLITQLVRAQNTLKITKENQTINKEIVEGLLDPKGLISKFLVIPWHDTSYVNQDIEGYPWYLLPPYIFSNAISQ